MFSQFGSDNVIFVPPGTVLTIDDIVHWRRMRVDVLRGRGRLRPDGFIRFRDALKSATDILAGSRKKPEGAPDYRVRAEEILRAVQVDKAPPDSAPGSTRAARELLGQEGWTWWIRFTDKPAESFHEEDYDEGVGLPKEPIISWPLYGGVFLDEFDELDCAMPETEEDSAFALDLPADDGLAFEELPTHEPLPLVREFCGARGSSIHGCTVNVDTRGDLVADHAVCTPLHRVGAGIFATLYLHLTVPSKDRVLKALNVAAFAAVAETLGQSGFAVAAEGETWRILDRDGDVVHLYGGLPGKEAEGFEYMPAFLLVARAGGLTDPVSRSELLGAILETMGRV